MYLREVLENKKIYLDHLDTSGLCEQASEAGAVHAEGEVTHKKFEVRREIGLILVDQDLLLLVEVRRKSHVPDKSRRQGKKPFGRMRNRNGVGAKP